MEKRIKLFLEFLQKDKKLSNNTLQSYKRDITQYESYINEENLQYLKVTNEDIKKYLENLKNIGKKTSTISRNLASIRSFYQYLVRTKKVKEDPTEGIQSPKVEKRVPSVLSSKEVELLLEQPKTVDLKGIRDKAMLEFAYATGMRVTEIINLNIDDVNLKEGYVSCSNANKQRNIPLGAISINALFIEYIYEDENTLVSKNSLSVLELISVFSLMYITLIIDVTNINSNIGINIYAIFLHRLLTHIFSFFIFTSYFTSFLFYILFPI